MDGETSNQDRGPDSNRETHERPSLREIGQLHGVTHGKARIQVAVLDGPVDLSHANLRDAGLRVIDNSAQRGAPGGDAVAHGTHVTSVILGREGVAPGCGGLVIPIYDEDELGRVRPASQEVLARAIHRAVDLGSHVINISGGQLQPLGEAKPELRRAVERCREENVLIVAAAGNDGCACLHVPAALPSVLAVAGADDLGRPLSSSNWSGPYQTQGILALGRRVPGAVPAGGLAEANGSSYATAVTSGVVALLLSAQLESGGRADPQAVRRVILSTASRCDPSVTAECHRHLAGHLNPRAAMSFITRGVDPMSEVCDQHQNFPDGPAEAGELAGASPSASCAEPRDLVGASPGERSITVAPTASPGAMAPWSPFEVASPASEAGITASRADEAVVVDGLEPSDCGCGGDARGLVYVLGQIDYDFGTLENFEWFKQNAKAGGQFINPNSPAEMLAYLQDHPEAASALIWTVTIAGVPVYALSPEDCYCETVYLRLTQFLEAQLAAAKEAEVAISAIPATIVGRRQLLNGANLPQIQPDLRGLFNFVEREIIDNAKTLLGLEKEPSKAQKAHLQSFLQYVVDLMRNLGHTASDRAVNYLAIQGYLALFSKSLSPGLDPDLPPNLSAFRLSSVNAAPNPFCLPGGDCWDVTLTLFDPENVVNIAPVVFRQTVDVAAVNPVLVGQAATHRVR